MRSTDPSAPLDELKVRTRELFTLLRATTELGREAAAAIEKAAGEVERRLAREERVILVLGDAAHRRMLVDAILGAPVLAAVQREARATMRLRWRATPDYEARLRGGSVERFQQSVPERDETFAKAIARAERDRVAAEEESRALAAEIAERSAETVPVETRTQIFALWAWFVAWLVRSFSPRTAPASLPSGSQRARARDAAERVVKATAHQATLERERGLYAAERRSSFFAALRGLTDDLSRGGEVIDITIDVPSSALPAGVTLVNGVEEAPYADVDGCIFVTDGAPAARERFAAPLAALGPSATLAIAPGAPEGEIRRAIDDIRRAAPLAAGERVISLARASIGSAIEDGVRAEAVCHARIAALEGQRLADPAEFRARSLARMDRAIDDGAGDVLRAALDRLSPRVEAMKTEWRSALLACGDRGAVEACVQAIRDEAPTRIAALVEELNEFVVSEMQRASDTMQMWVLEEIHARYQVARRSSLGDGPAPVIADAASGEFAALDGAPLADAMLAFEKHRVRYGLGGAAAGAVLGTLVAPVIGTAIGAFLGVFAGLLKGVDSLRRDCAATIEACIDESATQIRAQLESRRASLAGALRASLEEALDSAMQRFARSIARLMELETKTLAAEREKLLRLGTLRASLEDYEARFAKLGS